MNADEVLATLRKLGKKQTAEIYKRHGAGDNVYGVLTADIAKIQKKLKTDHALATALWKTGNAEARILALQTADPARLTTGDANGFLDTPNSHFYAYYLGHLVARSPIADEIMQSWMKASQESVREAGYTLLFNRLRHDAASIGDADAGKVLTTIEKEIHRSPNRARNAMNLALIAIGSFKASLRKKALEAAERIGKVEVDHGETNCKTPDAAAAIKKAAKR